MERLKINENDELDFIKNLISSENPDVIFLTETNLILDFGAEYFSFHSKELPSFHDNQSYNEKENRTSIFSKYSFTETIETYDNYTAICGKINTEFGELILYGSIIGSFGGRDVHFENDLENQKNEIKNLKENICYSGDFNIAFSGWKYPSIKVIDETKAFFNQQNLKILTEENENCAIHIVMNKDFLKNKTVKSKMIKIDRKISDHNAVICEIYESEVRSWKNKKLHQKNFHHPSPNIQQL
ncbi:endonuclease/exonuclease/phosphatase family protein [Epilithonimonas arachidiradicis]|uniref:endonuclease/exonuclease/phosphatase family protein n=1 Tax=Epilithonimonas arachidiradicis TaxID=1617282 RepID=UPI0021CF90F7|nr:endonuclease/exonuclease/phosphatase family protein [Epilithonimonas arachidiradicis]